jgi:hypothetical protein
LGVATPLWAKCEGETHTPKSGTLESSEIPENLELDLKGQNTLHWGVLGVIGKVLKCRCLNWPRIGHLDICNPSYGQKKGWESNWQFDSRPLKVGNRPLPDVFSRSATWRWKSFQQELQVWFKARLDSSLGREVMNAQSPGSPYRDSFEKKPFGCSPRAELQRTPGKGEEATATSLIKIIEEVQGGEVMPSNGGIVPTP